MPRVHHVKKARKDNPAVKKGQPYYHWQRYRSRKQYSATYPKRSQLTSSGKLAQIYDAEDAVGECSIDHDPDALLGSIESVKEVIDNARDSFREVAEEYEESASNLEEYFSGSEQIDDIREKASACEEAADNCDNVVDSLQEAYDRLEELGDRPVFEDEGEPLEENYDDPDDFEVNHADWETERDAAEDLGEEWDSERDDIANDADNALSEFEGPQF